MHIRVRLAGSPEAIVVVDSKLTKIDALRKLVFDKFGAKPETQRLFYGGKLLENGYTFHDYNIKLNDVIQLMVKSESANDAVRSPKKSRGESDKEKSKEIKYVNAESNLYEVGDLVDVRDREYGAWFEGTIAAIVRDPEYVGTEEETQEESPLNGSAEIEKLNTSNGESSSGRRKTNEKGSPKTPKNNKTITQFFAKASKSTEKDIKSKKSPTKNGKRLNMDTDVGVLYKVIYEEEEESTAQYCKLGDVRPRAREEIKVEELKAGDTVMVNHNTEESHEKGYWYDFTIWEIKKQRKSHELLGTLYLGGERVAQNDTTVKILDKIYKIESVVPLRRRTKEDRERMRTPIEKRAGPLNCTKCRDDEEAPCKYCGCYVCRGKENPEKIILCDECNYGYHMACLNPPVTEIPDEDWYCPDCKRDPNNVVAPGAAKQRKKESNGKKRDWGRGMACVGKTQTSAMPTHHYGPIPGIEVGMTWRFRIQLSESGVHRPPVSGIHGRDNDGAYSLVLSGGYEDDVDNGFEFTYTGSGGRDLSGNKRTADQSSDQTLTLVNKALARNCAVKDVSNSGGDAGAKWKDGKPVRVVRSYKMLKHFPEFAPEEGIRYDGIYKVVKYYPEVGKSGFRVWKYLLRRDDPKPAPWEKNAKKYPIIYPDGYLEAEAEKKAQKDRNSNPQPKRKKRKNGENDENMDLNGSVPDSPPPKKRRTRNSNQFDSPPDKPKTPKSDKKLKNNNTPFTIAVKSKSKSPKKGAQTRDSLTSEELNAIKKDKLNVKLWDECLNILEKSGKQKLLANVTQVFLCIICQEVAANPVTTKCLHNFCMSCLKLAFKSTEAHSCPYCRKDLSKDELEYNETLKTALRTLMPGYDSGKK